MLIDTRVIRHVGAPIRRKIHGRIFLFRKRIIVGRPDPMRSRAAKRGIVRHKAARNRAAKYKWRPTSTGSRGLTKPVGKKVRKVKTGIFSLRGRRKRAP